MEYIGGDECIEVTPDNIRLRKIYLDHNLRKRKEKQRLISKAIFQLIIYKALSDFLDEAFLYPILTFPLKWEGKL